MEMWYRMLTCSSTRVSREYSKKYLNIFYCYLCRLAMNEESLKRNTLSNHANEIRTQNTKPNPKSYCELKEELSSNPYDCLQ